jgi:hypothetical protein
MSDTGKCEAIKSLVIVDVLGGTPLMACRHFDDELIAPSLSLSQSPRRLVMTSEWSSGSYVIGEIIGWQSLNGYPFYGQLLSGFNRFYLAGQFLGRCGGSAIDIDDGDAELCLDRVQDAAYSIGMYLGGNVK